MQININEKIAPKNVATVDQLIPLKEGNVYNKPQIQNIITDAFKNINLGVKGEALPTSSPTPWVSGNPYLFEKYSVYTVGTYTNFGGITVNDSDLKGNFVFIEVTNGVSKKKVIPFQTVISTAKIPVWTATVFTSGSQVIYQGAIYESNTNTLATDLPGTSSKWLKILGGVDLENLISKTNTTKAVSGKSVYDFIVGNRDVFSSGGSSAFTMDKYLQIDGSFKSALGWVSTDFIPVIKNQRLTIFFYGFSSPGAQTPAVYLYDELKKPIKPLSTYPVIRDQPNYKHLDDIIIPENGFIVMSDRNYNGLTDYGYSLYNQIFASVSDVEKVNDSVGGFTVPKTFKDKKITNFSNSDFTDGFYYRPDEMINESTRGLKFPINTSDVISFKLRSLSGYHTLVIKYDDGQIDQFGSWGGAVVEKEVVALKKGTAYINLNTDAVYPNAIEFLRKIELVYYPHKTLVDFIKNDKKSNNVKENIPISNMYDNQYINLNALTLNSSDVLTGFATGEGFAISKLEFVQKGDIVEFTGSVAAHGIALYDPLGILIDFPYRNNVGASYVATRLTIPADGFIRVNYVKSEGYKLDIYRLNLFSEGVVASDNKILKTEKKHVYLNRPNGLWRIDLDGNIPQKVEETSTLDFSISENGRKIFYSNVKLKWQGQSSLAFAKKNFDISILNTSMEKVTVKIGDLIGSDSFHLKGFQNDTSFIRDHLGCKTWYDIRKAGAFPDNRIDNLPNDLDLAISTQNYFEEDAKFFPDGFPVEIYSNDFFLGIYVLRLKKSMSNYRMNPTLKTNIFLEFDYTLNPSSGYLNYRVFTPAHFEMKSPKIAGYSAGQIINDPTVMASINKLWAFTSAVTNGTAIGTTVNNVMLSAWIDYLIALEFVGHFDSMANNILFGTHDGQVWSPYFYDTDYTFGLNSSIPIINARTKMILDSPEITGLADLSFWKKFRTLYLPQIKSRYTELRNNGTISIQSLEKNANNFIKNVGAISYDREVERSGVGFFPQFGRGHLRQILTYGDSAIKYLDSQWKI